MRFAGKTAVIVGSGPNIGAALALAFAGEGAKVACVDVQPKFAEACAGMVARAGGRALPVTCDATHEQQVADAVHRIVAELGGIDVLVNGAAVRIAKGVLDGSVEEFRRQIDVCLAGAFLFTQHAARSMIAAGIKGSIINIISTEGHQGFPGSAGYGTAKAGLLNFTRSVAMELAPYGIRVNSLTPTSTDPSEGLQRAAEWGLQGRVSATSQRKDFAPDDIGLPLSRRPKPSDYAGAALFLASDEAAMITGFDLRVDAGVLARYWRWMPGASP